MAPITVEAGDLQGKRPEVDQRNVDDNFKRQYEKRCSVPCGCKGPRFMEKEDQL
jgi:hypothetical protein